MTYYAPLQRTPRLLHSAPKCELREITRVRVIGGYLVDYEGADRNVYHKVVGQSGPIWLITIRAVRSPLKHLRVMMKRGAHLQGP